MFIKKEEEKFVITQADPTETNLKLLNKLKAFEFPT